MHCVVALHIVFQRVSDRLHVQSVIRAYTHKYRSNSDVLLFSSSLSTFRASW